MVSVPLDDTRWRSERQVKKSLKRLEPDLIIDARLISLLGGPDTIGQPDLERSRWLAGLVGRMDCRYLLLSSSRVFSGTAARPYRETDTPDSTDAEGSFFIESEQLFTEAVSSLFVLRIGWLFSGRGPGPFKQLLDQLRQGRPIYATDRRRDCPVHTAEVARVVAGIIDQISVGAPDKGLYHYGSDGDTGWFAFNEAVVAHATQYEVFKDAADLLLEEPQTNPTLINRALDCTAIRHQFGIQRRPWRDFVERAIRRYVELYCKEK